MIIFKKLLKKEKIKKLHRKGTKGFSCSSNAKILDEENKREIIYNALMAICCLEIDDLNQLGFIHLSGSRFTLFNEQLHISFMCRKFDDSSDTLDMIKRTVDFSTVFNHVFYSERKHDFLLKSEIFFCCEEHYEFLNSYLVDALRPLAKEYLKYDEAYEAGKTKAQLKKAIEKSNERKRIENEIGTLYDQGVVINTHDSMEEGE